jgi:hypothetical protein
MSTIRLTSLCFVVALAIAPFPASAQGGPPGAAGANLAARVEALEAAVAALQSGQTALNSRVGKLEGNITAADLAGTYKAAGLFVDLDGGFPARIEVFTLNAVATLNADGTGVIEQQGNFLGLIQGAPWTEQNGSFPPESIAITWSYANGILHVSDGTVNLDVDFVVGAGGRVATFSGIGDDGEADFVVLTRLQ